MPKLRHRDAYARPRPRYYIFCLLMAFHPTSWDVKNKSGLHVLGNHITPIPFRDYWVIISRPFLLCMHNNNQFVANASHPVCNYLFGSLW